VRKYPSLLDAGDFNSAKFYDLADYLHNFGHKVFATLHRK